MKTKIQTRINELKASAEALNKQIGEAQAFIQKTIPILNATIGAIQELEQLLKDDSDAKL